MEMNIMPRPGWISISIPEKTINKIKKVIEQNPHLGYKSTSSYITDALRKLFSEHTTLIPRFRHININIKGNSIILRDNLVGRDVDIHFPTGGAAHCDDCGSAACVHIDYALSMHDVTEWLKRRGWKRKN